MKRVIFDCERMKYSNTGIYHYCLNLGRELQRVHDPRAEEFVFFSPKSSHQLFNGNVRSIAQNSLHKFLMPSTGSFDIWHSTYQNTDYLPIRNRRIKVVLTIHDLNFIHDIKKSPAKKTKYLRHLQRNIDRSDRIVCISEFSKSDVLKYCDINEKNIVVIHNGTNSLEQPELLPLSYKPSGKFLFSIGLLTRKKNFHSLLPLLQNGEMELLIAGRCEEPVYLEFLLNDARKLGVEKNLHILGAISEAEKSWYFKNCYAFASSSVAEGFCMPVTEAMSEGKPLFLSDLTALPEIGGKVAFYFSDFERNHMQDIFNSGMRLYRENNMKDEIILRGSTFCWKKAALQYLEVYRSLY